MPIPITEKARNLQRLSALLPAPPFVVLKPGEEPPESLLDAAPLFIIRGCLADEDLPGQSMAGQGMTCGPVAAAEVHAALRRVFHDSAALECICQVYIDAPSGVLICTAETQAMLEYSRQPGGVTGGRLSPFVAIFPNDIPRYAALTRDLPLLWRTFGACDVELLRPEDPVFVQVRPFTGALCGDEAMLRAKMVLQEIEGERWVQNEFCADLLESPWVEYALIELYCEELARVLRDIGAPAEQPLPSDFIKIGRQVFMRDRDITPQLSHPSQVMRVGYWMFQEYTRLATSLRQGGMIAGELMRAAIIFRTYYDLLERLPAWMSTRKRARVFDLRQQCRQQLLAIVSPAPLPPLVTLTNRLQPLIEKDQASLRWISMDYVSEQGVVIVPGDFAQGPWQAYLPDAPPPAQPCFLVTDELYPEIYTLFPYIKGIICHGGGIHSHLALLAREWGMPLWIQLPDAQRFLQ